MRFAYWLRWKLFGKPSVWLIDYDGEENLRPVRFTRDGRPWVWRWPYLKHNRCFLRMDGSVSGPTYVRRWEPAKWCPVRQTPRPAGPNVVPFPGGDAA